MPTTERTEKWSRWPARSTATRERRPDRQPLHADATIVDLGGGQLAEVEVSNRTSRGVRFWIGGEAVETPHVADVEGNASGKVIVPVRAGTLEVRHGGPTGAAIMVGEVPEPAWGSASEGDST